MQPFNSINRRRGPCDTGRIQSFQNLFTPNSAINFTFLRPELIGLLFVAWNNEIKIFVCIQVIDITWCCVQEPELPTDHPAQEPLLLLCAQLGYHHYLPGGRGQQPRGGVQEPSESDEPLPPIVDLQVAPPGSSDISQTLSPALIRSFACAVMVDWSL